MIGTVCFLLHSKLASPCTHNPSLKMVTNGYKLILLAFSHPSLETVKTIQVYDAFYSWPLHASFTKLNPQHKSPPILNDIRCAGND